MGTRGPSPWASTWGGGTWSHQPPLESHITTIAALFQMVDVWICRINVSSQVIPLATGPLPGCMLWPGPGWINATVGGLAARSPANFEKSRTFGELCESAKNWNGFSCGTYLVQSPRSS